MTLTLELPEELEKALEAEAQRRGTHASQIAGEVLIQWSLTHAQTSQTRQTKTLKSYGLLKGRKRTVDDFLSERHQETEIEENQHQERVRLRQEHQHERQVP